MKKTLMIVGLILAAGGAAFAASGTPNASVKSYGRTLDASGYAVQIPSDKPWNVFAVEYSATAAQVVDARGNAPKQGLVGRICLESAPAIPSASDWAILWDTITAANMTATGTGRRIFPPVQRVSGVEHCVDVNAQFTSGLGLMQGATTGSTYVYWK
jgi:hypothetical protein